MAGKKKRATPPRSPRPAAAGGAAPDAFSLSRRHHLAPVVPADEAFHRRIERERDHFLLELAWDGHRVLATRVGDGVRLVSADLREWSATFPGLCLALRRVPAPAFVIEGALVAFDAHGRPAFESLRAHVQGTPSRVAFVAWDLFHLEGEDLAPLPLSDRRGRLRTLLAGISDVLLYSEDLPGPWRAVRDAVRALGVRGILARRAGEAHPPAEPWRTLAAGASEVTWERGLSPPPPLTNPQKVLYPRDGFTKSDVAAYYADVAPVLLAHMRDRPVVAQRWPDGIDAFTWYQHRPPPRAPDYLGSVSWEGDRRLLIDSGDALAFMVNQAALTFHGWSSRRPALAEPDRVVLDLDPGPDTRWEHVIEVALALRRLLELMELPSVVKTSGQKGLHVLVPVAPGHTPEDAHTLGRGMAGVLVRLLPALATLEPDKAKRKGRLLVDHLQNFVGKSLVLPYSLRAADGAPVSTPLSWDEVTPRLDPRAFTLRTLRARLDARGDLAGALLKGGVALGPPLARLQGL